MSLTKRSLAEFVGTFWLVFAGCGSAVLAVSVPTGGIGLVGVALAFGLALLTMAYTIGPISGCHINPAVSIGMSIARRFPVSELPAYILSQTLGGIGGAGLLYIIAQGKPDFDIGSSLASNGYGSHSPGGYSLTSCFLIEIVLTFFFLFVILRATDKRAPQSFAPLAIGFALTLVHLIGIPVTNVSVNPARSMGPAVIVGSWPFGQLWLFWVAPTLGALFAGWIYGLFAERDPRKGDIMDGLNIVDLVHSNMSGAFGARLASVLEESRVRTQAGINAAVTGILSGLADAASTSEGSDRLASAVSEADTSVLFRIGSFIESRLSGDSSTGTLRSILGIIRFSELSANVGKSSGLSPNAVTSLLNVLAPIVFSVLKNVKDSRRLDSAGMANFLTSQRSNIWAAMRKDALPATHTTGRSAATQSSTWIVPLLLLTGLISSIWYWNSQSGVRAGRDETGLAERTAKLKDQYKYGTAVSLQNLKMTYRSVIDAARSQGIEISSLYERDGKLVIQGTAPSQEAANKVWEEIKRIDPDMRGVIANFSVQNPGSQ